MSTPFLATKLHIPPPRPDLVPRPRLIERLEQALRLGHRATLVSAQAGFGKTTLLSQWVHAGEQILSHRRVGWLSLDEGDDDPLRFWAYFIAALQTIREGVPQGIGESTLAALQGARPLPLPSALTGLINDLADAPGLVLILDDYHLIDNAEIHQALGFFLEHQPPQMHLIIATRKDPPLPLSRLRARGQLTEIRVADLKFTPSEASAFFEQTAGLSLATDQVSALATRTEGWITGLQLASLALQQQAPQQVPEFVQAFTGSHRFVLDYLLEEVLHRQESGLQAFLLQTSILERLSGPLCDAVLDRPATSPAHSQQVLEQLEAANLFILPLDGERRWFRYHRLFADLLRARLGREGVRLNCAPAFELHRRASAWYGANGYPAEAIGHALAAGDSDSAARLIEEHALSLLTRGELTTLLNWLAALPEGSIRVRPWLCIYHAWALALSGQVGAAERRLGDAEAAGSLDRTGDELSAMPARQSSQALTQAQGHVAAIRSYVALHRGDMKRTVELARRALDLLDEEDLVVRSVVAFTLGVTHLASGETAAAARAFARASEMGLAGGNIHLAVPAAAYVADLEVQQGHLHRAFEAYRRTLDLAKHSPVAAQAHSGLSQLWFEWNNLETAREHLTRSIEMGRAWGNVEALCGDYAMLAWLSFVQGDDQAADGALREARQLVQEKELHPRVVAMVAAAQARLAAARGDLAAAERWVRDSGPDPGEELDPLREKECVTLARVLLALGQAEDAAGLLARLLAAVERDGRLGLAVELLALQALAHRMQGDQTSALAALEQALVLAEPEGYVRTFVDEGEPMADLLSALSNQDSAVGRETLAKLLAAFGLQERFGQGGPEAGTRGLVEALSEREIEVLRLVAAGLTNQEIADHLVIALSTVKSHTNHIYGKLGVKNRTQAIARADSLNLL